MRLFPILPVAHQDNHRISTVWATVQPFSAQCLRSCTLPPPPPPPAAVTTATAASPTLLDILEIEHFLGVDSLSLTLSNEVTASALPSICETPAQTGTFKTICTLESCSSDTDETTAPEVPDVFGVFDELDIGEELLQDLEAFGAAATNATVMAVQVCTSEIAELRWFCGKL